MAYDLDRCLQRYKDLQQEKRPFLQLYQDLAEIFLTRKANFTVDSSLADFTPQEDVFDNTGQFAAYLMASTFLSMLWPDASRTFRLKPSRRIKDAAGVDKFFRFLNDEMWAAMDRPRAGLSLALMEHFLDQGVFGTSGVGAFEGPEDDPSLPVVFESWDVKAMCISQNAQGYVDTIFAEFPRTARQVVEEFSREGDVVANAVREAVARGDKEAKVKVLRVIEPKTPEPGKEGQAGMSVRVLHIDLDNKVIMREGAFDEMPVFVARMFKRIDETYGRSAAMTAMPDAYSLNAITESMLVAAEKQLDPPLGVLDDGRLGGGSIDTSAGALNVFNAAGRIGNAANNPIFPLYTVGEMRSTEKMIEKLIEKIMAAFFLDRLLDLNNTTQMTAFEASVRNRMRGEALSSIFARQEMEVLTPLIERSFNIMWRRGHFGIAGTGIGAKLRRLWAKITGAADVEIPEIVTKAVEAGLDVYEIEYISPAKRFQQAEKLQGMFTVVDGASAMAPFLPTIMDNFNPDTWIRDLAHYAGSPLDGMRTMDELKAYRAAVAAKQEQAEQLMAGKEMSEIARNAAQARATLGTAGGGGRKE